MVINFVDALLQVSWQQTLKKKKEKKKKSEVVTKQAFSAPLSSDALTLE